MDLQNKIAEKILLKNYGITQEIARKYGFELSDIWKNDAIFIHKKELNTGIKNG